MKYKRQSRGHVSHADSSPRRSADDDDDDDDDECVDERRRAHGTSTVTSRSGSPAVDSTTDCCSLTADDVRTPADRSNEPSLLSAQQSSLDNDETPTRCSDKTQRQSEHEHVSNVADLPTGDLSASDCNTAPQTSVLATADTVNIASITPSDTQNNLARLEIMTCIAGGDVDHRQNTAGLQMDATMRPRRGHAGGAVARSTRATNSRCDGRRVRAAGHSKTRNGALTAACSATDALANYRCASIFNGDSVHRNCVSEFRRESHDITRDLESTLGFPGGTYSDAARYLYSDLTADGLFTSDGYPNSSVSLVYQQQQPPSQSYGAPNDSHFQSAAVVGRPSSPPALHCNVTSVRSDRDSFTSFPYPPIHSAASLPVCDSGWQTWKDWRWNDCTSFPASVVDYDDEYSLHVSGEHVNWRPSVDTRGWTNSGHDIGNDVIRTSLPANQAMGATRRSYWSGDCTSSGYRCTSNYGMPYYDGSSASSRASANCCSVSAMPPTSSSRFYDGQYCYMPASNSLSAGGAAEALELTPCQSVYQSCKYSGVVDRQYSAGDSSCIPQAFVNTA